MISDFIKLFKTNTNNFSNKINDSIYIEGNNVEIITKGKSDICEIIIGNNSIEYDTLEENHKNQFIRKEKINIASDIKIKKNYSKEFNFSIINKGFQNLNYLSSILYLNEHYQINCVIFNNETNKYYTTTLRKFPIIICEYKNNSWFLKSHNGDKLEYCDNISDLSNILTIDCSTIIWKPAYFPISKYKLNDLKEYCNQFSIPLVDENGKKKVKKQLYDDLNLNYYINQ